MMTKQSEPLRYSMYYWLMNASLVAIVFGLSGYVVEYFTGMKAFGMSTRAQLIIAPIPAILATIVPALLIGLRFWRDEYAEMLWKQTASSLMFIMAVVPPIIYFSSWAIYLLLGSAEPPALLEWVTYERRLGSVLQVTWYFLTGMFVCVFQFHRWRASL